MDTASTLWDVFHRSLRTNAERPALSVGEERYTYDDLAHLVAGATQILAEAGVDAGDRVVLLTENCTAFPVFDLAIMSRGAVKVPLNPMVSASDVAYVVEQVSPAAIVVSDSLRPLLASLGSPPVIIPAVTPPQRPPLSLPAQAPARPDDTAVIYFTGGTTGKPKGIVHDHRSTVANLWAHLLEGDIRRDERLLLVTPVAHAAGLFTLAGLLRGAHVRLENGFDPRQVIERMTTEAITWTFLVPTTIYRLLDAAEETDWRAPSLRTIQYGAAPISTDQLRRALERFGPVLQQLYAQTENPNYATLLRKEDHVRALEAPHLLSSCGRATIMCDVAVLDQNGDPLPAGATGEIAFRSPYLMHGYWANAQAAEGRFVNGWMLSGDIGFADEDGYFYLVDRRNDMIVTGGLNVYSIEVEQVLLRHPAVKAVAVVGREHPDWGEAVHAVVVPAADLDLEELSRFARAELAAYKRPKAYEVVEALPLTPYGKVDKKVLRGRAEAVAR